VSLLEEGLKKLQDLSTEGRIREPEKAGYWDALDAAILATAERATTLETHTWDFLKSMLEMWSGTATTATKLALIRGATISELISGTLQDANDLRDYAEKRAKQREDVLNWLMDLGIVGAKLLLKVLVI